MVLSPASLFLLLLSVSGVISSPDKRSDTSSAQCLADSRYNWTMNAQKQSPCLLAATVVAPCSTTGVWNIPPLGQPGYHYDSPSLKNGTATPCYCSWVAYNLINACTVCQGFDSITSWYSFAQECGSMVSTDRYYPPDMSAKVDATIPYYATWNPMHWPGSTFNTNEAIAQSQGHSDINIATNNIASTASSSTSMTAAITSSAAAPTVTVSQDTGHISIGAIAGGTILGLVVFVLSGVVVIWFLRHRTKKEDEEDKSKLLKSEDRIEPFPWSPPPTPVPRVKSPSSSLASTERSSRTSTLMMNVVHPVDTLDNVDGLDISPGTNPPPYTQDPQATESTSHFIHSQQTTADSYFREYYGTGHYSPAHPSSPRSPFGSNGGNTIDVVRFASPSPTLRQSSLGSGPQSPLRFYRPDDGHHGDIARMIA